MLLNLVDSVDGKEHHIYIFRMLPYDNIGDICLSYMLYSGMPIASMASGQAVFHDLQYSLDGSVNSEKSRFQQ